MARFETGENVVRLNGSVWKPRMTVILPTTIMMVGDELSVRLDGMGQLVFTSGEPELILKILMAHRGDLR